MSYPAIRGGPRPAQDTPDWVVIGVRQRDGEDGFEFELARPAVRRSIYHVTVGMRKFTCVVADSYEQALRTLFETWSPEPEVASTRLEIEG